MGNIHLKGFILCNKAYTHYTTNKKRIASFFTYLVDYWYDRHNTWAFIPNNNIPIPIMHITNPLECEWIYHYTTNTLTHVSSLTNKQTHVPEWLSTQLVIDSHEQHTEYDIDEFMGSLQIITDQSIPTLSMIYSCWCIYTKQWFSSTSLVTYNIIDSKGDEHQIILNDENQKIKIEICLI